MLNKLPVYKTEGIIIKAADLGELDRVLTIYTRGHGKIQVRAISARKKTAKLNGLLQSFTSGQFLLAKKSVELKKRDAKDVKLIALNKIAKELK